MTTIASSGVSLTPNTNPTLTTGTVEIATLVLANVEYPYTFPAQTKAFIVHARLPGIIKIAFSAGDIADGNYLTIFAGAAYDREGIGSASTRVYLESPVAGLVVELESWV